MNAYLERFIDALNKTVIYNKSHTVFPDYTLGLDAIINELLVVRGKKRAVFFVGNGGSAAIASHMTVDFMKNGRMRTCSLMESSVLTCMGNDYAYEYIYSEQLNYLGEEGDALIAISSSGNSDNICNAIHVAMDRKMKVITFSGFYPDNKLLSMGDYRVYVPAKEYGIVESIHNLMLQQVVDEIMEKEKI